MDFDVITMFGVGPSSHITDPEHVEKSYQTVINILSSVLPTGGVIILTTSFGGPKRENLIRYLEESGLEVSVNESNKYGEMLGNKLGFTHDEIIIATKKAEQENKTHKIMDGI